MKPLLSNLHCFISLSSPHLGTIYADSPLVSTGMWALFKVFYEILFYEILFIEILFIYH
jgi:hypothetical protein